MRTLDHNPYRWWKRNSDHAAHTLPSMREHKAGVYMFNGRNRAFTRAFRSNTGPRPLLSRVAPFEQIGWSPAFRTYTHPRSPRS